MNGGMVGHSPYKKKICNNFAKGNCLAGSDCTFAHGTRELRTFENPIYKSMLCTSYDQGGICQMGTDCLLAHGEIELRFDDVTIATVSTEDENTAPSLTNQQTKELKKSAYKSALCIHFMRQGNCNLGKGCAFAHGKEELTNVAPPDTNDPKYKTKLCLRYEQDSFCPSGEHCVFAHGEDELKAQSGSADKSGKLSLLYKTSLCNNFATLGMCPNGKNCSFAHGKYELRPVGFDGDFEAKIAENPKWKCLKCNIYVQTGHCNRVNCDFAHGEEELRNEFPEASKAVKVKVNYKTAICNNFAAQGYCFHEDKCSFAHGEHELNKTRDAAAALKIIRESAVQQRKRPKIEAAAGGAESLSRSGGNATVAAMSSPTDQTLFAEFLEFKKFKQQSDTAAAAAVAPVAASYFNSKQFVTKSVVSTPGGYYGSTSVGEVPSQPSTQAYYGSLAGGFRKQAAPVDNNTAFERQKIAFRANAQAEYAY